MRVSNAIRPDYRPIKVLDRAQWEEGGFSDLVQLELQKMESLGELSQEITTREGYTVRVFYVKENEGYDPEHTITLPCIAWGRTFETNEELSKYYPHCSFPMDLEMVKVDLSALTDEIKAELNAKYQINNIKPYSEEYFSLMKDLQEAGVLSDGNAYKLPPNIFNLTIDENGKVTRFATQLRFEINGKNTNFLDYTKNCLSFVADDFEMMSKWDWLTDEEQAALSVNEMHKDIVAAIEEIFAGQLK